MAEHAHLVENSYTPNVVVPLVMGLVKPESVGDWGCNCGVWLDAFRRNGVEILFGYDMLPHNPGWLVKAEEFKQVNFEEGVPVRKCDLAVSLENAEHIDGRWADDLIDALTESAPVVLFSAATPGQGGDHHVNEQPHSYWHYKFMKRGYGFVDWIRWAIRDDPKVFKWYRDNIFLYTSRPLPT